MALDAGLIRYDPGACFHGYTLFCAAPGGTDSDAPPEALLIDMQGRICGRWQHPLGIQYAVLLPNGHLLCRAAPVPGLEAQRGLNGQAAAVFELDRDGNQVWAHVDDWLHHDFERLANGNTLLIKWVPLTRQMTRRVRGGYRSDDDPPRMLADLVLEVAPDNRIVREWKSWEHLDVQVDVICPLEHRQEWTHCNSVAAAPDGSWLLSFRRTNTIALVDPATGAFKWRWTSDMLGHQHDAKYLPNGNILLFDNGAHRRGPEFSRVLEIDAHTRESVWTYQAESALTFFSFMGGGADRLANGNTLICDCAHGRLFEVTPDKATVWEYVNPFYRKNPRTGGVMNGVYRAHRYAPDHPALTDQDLDPARHTGLNPSCGGA